MAELRRCSTFTATLKQTTSCGLQPRITAEMDVRTWNHGYGLRFDLAILIAMLQVLTNQVVLLGTDCSVLS